MRLRFSMAFECKTCHRIYREPEPRLFSFNNPYGACPRCQGFGNTIDFDLNLIIPDKSKTLEEGAIDPWTRPKYRPYYTELKRSAKSLGVPLDVPWHDLSLEQQETVLNGSGSFLGVHGFFEFLERKKYKLHVRVMLSKYRGYAQCPECKGQRLARRGSGGAAIRQEYLRRRGDDDRGFERVLRLAEAFADAA